MKKRFLFYFLALVLAVSVTVAQEKVTNGNLESGNADGWSFEYGGTGAATLEASNVNPISGTYSLHVTVTTAGSAVWHIQLCNKFAVVKDKKYVISFKARASAPATETTMMQQDHDPYGTIYSKAMDFTTVAQVFKDSVVNSEIGTDTSAKLNFNLGLLPVGTELWFDDVSVVESNAPVVAEAGLKIPGTEKIVNGFFEAGTTPWTLELSGTGAATYTLDTTKAIQGTLSAHIQVTNAGTNDYDVQFRQPMGVVNGKRYFSMFKARASKDVMIKAGIQQYHGSYSFLSPFKAESLHVATRTVLDTSGYMTADDANCKYTMFLGGKGTFDVWVDFVTVIENTMGDPLGIKIDGDKDDFYKTLTNPDDGKIFIPCRAYIRDIGTAPTNNPATNSNSSAIVWTAWDRDYLYYYAEVKDDIVLDNNATNWSNDKIEIKLNPDPTIISTSASLQVGISALGVDDAQVPEAVDNLSVDKNLFQNGVAWVSTINDYARKVTSDGYVLEWRLPINSVSNSAGTNRIQPGVGGKFGEVIQVADNDDTQRRSMISWSSGMADVLWSNPQLHGSVTFLANNKLKYVAVSPQVPQTYHNDSDKVWYYGALNPDAVHNTPNSVPGTFSLQQNYPNPFNPITTIEFSLPVKSEIRLTVINLLGQEVKVVAKGSYNAGSHKVTLDASTLASGIYFYKLKADSYSDVKKLVLMK
ncbi:MAG: T9SS C-terminal target domain-containing protein [Ignavibacteriae bacterium]|nr:MAG: T9SS C-terminal target domain-containing protein [Ignavibacteriota bacterium]